MIAVILLLVLEVGISIAEPTGECAIGVRNDCGRQSDLVNYPKARCINDTRCCWDTSAIPYCYYKAFRELIITVDNELELYIDGVQVTSLPNANDWDVPDMATFASTARVLAVKGTDTGVPAGLLASTFDNSIVSDDTWKVSNQLEPGWTAPEFNDSGWQAATVIGNNGVGPWGPIFQIDGRAKWIWTAKHNIEGDSDSVVYFRKTLTG